MATTANSAAPLLASAQLRPPPAYAPPVDVNRRAAAAVRGLVGDAHFRERGGELEDLAQALDSAGLDQRGWDKVDLHAAFAPDVTILMPGRPFTPRLLGVLATVSVFVPIAWTWFSLNRAASAYSTLLASGSGDGESFLQLWVTGFGGNLSHLHRLVPVSLISVAMISMSVLLIALSRLVSSRSEAAAHAEFDRVAMSLASVLTLAQRALAEAIMADAASIEGLVRLSTRELAAAHRQTAEAAQNMAQTVADAQRSTAALSQYTDALVGQATQVSQVSAQAAQALHSAVQATSDGIITSLSSLNVHLTEALDAFAHSSQVSLRSGHVAVAEAAGDLNTSATEMARASGELATAAKDLGASARGMPAGFAGAIHGVLDAAVQQLASTSATVAGAVASFETETASLDRSLTANHTTSQAQITELTQAREALERIATDLNAITSRLSVPAVTHA